VEGRRALRLRDLVRRRSRDNELREGGKSIGRMAWGQYGNRVGVPRILKLLKKYDVPATFYVPRRGRAAPSRRAAAGDRGGHEIGIHSWIHELNSVLSYEAEATS
jgi:peptidoglycan/xylan/chitin deacetylase (PgdA/CDA1 family)